MDLNIAAFVPGGILETDHVHVRTYDETCSRCRKAIQEWDVPLMLWLPPDQENILVYCDGCNGLEPKMPHCRECGCWDYDACVSDTDEPCHWVEPDLCSSCHKEPEESPCTTS